MTIYRRPDPLPRPVTAPVRPLAALRAEVTTLNHQGARQIFQAIIDGHFPEGSILPKEEDLGDQLQISRTALREAISTLAAKGVLEPRRKRGTLVLPRLNWSALDRELVNWSMGPSTNRTLHELWQTVDGVLKLAIGDACAEHRPQNARDQLPPLAGDLDHWRQNVLVWIAGCGDNQTFGAIVAQALACLRQVDPSFLTKMMSAVTEKAAGELTSAIVAGDAQRALHIYQSMTAQPQASIADRKRSAIATQD